jgi:hypothetical protein
LILAHEVGPGYKALAETNDHDMTPVYGDDGCYQTVCKNCGAWIALEYNNISDISGIIEKCSGPQSMELVEGKWMKSHA